MMADHRIVGSNAASRIQIADCTLPGSGPSKHARMDNCGLQPALTGSVLQGSVGETLQKLGSVYRRAWEAPTAFVRR